jgi:predicted Ser/Thr protein kinase
MSPRHDDIPLSAFHAARRIYADLDEPDDVSAMIGRMRSASVPDIAGYVIESELGRGRSGVVYRAYPEGSERAVALKLLNRHMGPEARSAGAERAWRELHVLSQLRSPNVPRLIDYGEHRGRLFLVTDLIDGQPLDIYCDRNDLTRRQRVALLIESCRALQALHQFGVIHRDVKPGNILIDRHGRAMIIDLGVALLLDDDVMCTLTVDGAPIGSPAFMPPEQARGDRASISTASDVYGLGATALYILTGATPHDMNATLHEAVRRVAQDAPRNPRELDPTVPKPLSAVLGKALAPSPAQRYPSAAAFAADLQRWLENDPVEAAGLSMAHRFGRFVGRHPIAATLAGCLLIMTLVFAFTVLSVRWWNMRPYQVVLTEEGRAATLRARSDLPLRTWRTALEQPIFIASLFDAEIPGHDDCMIIGLHSCEDERLAGQLHLYDLDDYEGDPIWSSGRDDVIEMPSPISDVERGRHVAWGARLFDIFPESEGVEIVALYRHQPSSPNLVRIYGADMSVLYEFWHDGHIADLFWHAPSGLLICCGVNSEAHWRERGHDEIESNPYPHILFAMRPELGERHQEWIRTPGGAGTLDAEWYVGVHPPDIVGRTDELEPKLGFESGDLYDPTGETVRFNLSGSIAHHGTMRIYFDPRTGAIRDVIPCSNYTMIMDKEDAAIQLPRPEEFFFDALPSILPEYRHESAEAP